MNMIYIVMNGGKNMAKKEIKTDLWVNELLKEARIKLTPQGCDIIEIDNYYELQQLDSSYNEDEK